MIDVYYAPTPNGHKITLFLEETGVPYQLHHLDISTCDQFKPTFLGISPNNKIPAIVDNQPADGGAPLSLFESCTILLYLAEKTGQLLSHELRERHTTLQWFFWQMAGFGTMLGQNHYFSQYAPEKVPYAINRYRTETARLYNVLDKQLQDHRYIAGEQYSIADIATYPWAVSHEKQDINLADYPAVQRWFNEIRTRPAAERAWRRANGQTLPARLWRAQIPTLRPL